MFIDKKVIILLGAPGSGKGTQARMIAERCGYAHISTGDLLRTILADPNTDSKDIEIVAEIKEGHLVADDFIFRIAFAEIRRNLDAGRGVVLDGAIRTVAQAEGYTRFFEGVGVGNSIIAVLVDISDETATKRLLLRQELEGRQDDTAEIIRKRIEVQGNAALAPIVAWYRERGELVRVDGEKSIEEVGREIQGILKGC